ncbi:MAG: hypothetical protein IPK82_27850 [Polyangiaceae bacterium]|nr:hypothetical protein [Polyangiaceae bacterium]
MPPDSHCPPSSPRASPRIPSTLGPISPPAPSDPDAALYAARRAGPSWTEKPAAQAVMAELEKDLESLDDPLFWTPVPAQGSDSDTRTPPASDPTPPDMRRLRPGRNGPLPMRGRMRRLPEPSEATLISGSPARAAPRSAVSTSPPLPLPAPHHAPTYAAPHAPAHAPQPRPPGTERPSNVNRSREWPRSSTPLPPAKSPWWERPFYRILAALMLALLTLLVIGGLVRLLWPR